MMMDDPRVADYFVVAGLPEYPEPIDDNSLCEGRNLKSSHGKAPITDIGIIFPTLGEKAPEGYTVITRTPTGLTADLNHGSLRSIECFICYRRGRDKPPLVDIGVMYEGKERLMSDAEVVQESVGKHVANVNNSSSQTFITYRRGAPSMPCNALIVTDICVVIASKGESPPHAFCCISKNLNRGIVGSDVFLCYKKSMNRPRLLNYKPSVLSRYPLSDLPDFPFPHSVPLFCLPMGASLELWPAEASSPVPVFSTFVLTVSDAKHKVYGSAITFYEEFPIENLTDEQREILEYEDNEKSVLNASKSICVLSHWPFSEALKSWLLFLHRTITSGEPQPIPIERYIIQLLDEVPFPSPRTLLQLPNHSYQFFITEPEDLPLPRNAAGFKHMLMNLGSENCLQLLLLVLTEQKILIHSLRPDELTAVAEAVSSLLFPFKWQCPYIPLCPLGLVEVLHAPLPFLIGVDSRFFDLYDPPSDVSCVDLDTNIITVPESQRHILNYKLLPKRAAKSLKSTLDYLHYQIKNTPITPEDFAQDDVENMFQRIEKQQAQELKIQEAFLRFMAVILKGYRSYLLPITKAPTVGTTDPEALFQLNDFLKSRDKAYHKFFMMLMKTQMFIRFIEERSFVADGDQGLTFFDEITEKLTHEDDGHLIDFDVVHKSDRTVFVLPPEPTSQDTNFVYKSFILNPMLLTSRKKHPLSLFNQTITPGSPMARRTKHEIKSAQKLARKSIRSPEMWARCLCGTCYTIYFMVLPSILSLHEGKEKIILQQAYELLVSATKRRLTCDEVCYRLMMQLCGEHSKPLLAVKLLVQMKKYNIQPNALTYGFYNRCVLEAEWPAHSGSSQLLWNKLRNVVMGAAHFKWAAKLKAAKKSPSSAEIGSASLDPSDRVPSRSSLDSHEAISTENNKLIDKFLKAANIVKSSLNGSVPTLVDNNSAQLICKTHLNGSEPTLISNNSDNVDSSSKETPEEIKDLLSQKSEDLSSNFVQPESPNEYRILTRSESAGDANLIDKLRLSNKGCSRSLHFNDNSVDSDGALNSPGKTSLRMTITENDPLGAFEDAPPVINSLPPEKTRSLPHNVVLSDDPILFKSSVQRSATFEGSPPTKGKIHRSETVPASSVASSLANLGSSFRIGFSPSSLTGKKSNELLQGSLSTIKSAATSMVKKLDEIKEAISTSTTSTPVKVHGCDRLASGDAIEGGECESTDGSEAGDRHRRVSGELGSYRGSYTNLKDSDEPLPDNVFLPPSDEVSDSAVDISVSSCSQCHNCLCLLYDEDIMANWSAEDSNLNTLCQCCGKSTVPLLTISIKEQNIPSCDPFSIPYLNPLVLRKELENILAHDGDLCLANSKFIDEHPIIYWNLVWTFERINVQTHLPNLYLLRQLRKVQNDDDKVNGSNLSPTSSSMGNMQPVEEGADPLTQKLVVLEQLTAQVSIRCLWDEPRLHTDGLPMYILWSLRDTSTINSENQNVSKMLMKKIISNIRLNDLAEPLRSLATERDRRGIAMKHDRTKSCTHSLYRDILFLACKALGRDYIDLNVFDREYTNAFLRVTEHSEGHRQYGPQDRPISLNSLYCRQFFRPLSLL